MDFIVLNIRLIEGDEGLHPVAIRYEENGVQYERLTSAEEIIRLLKKAAGENEKPERFQIECRNCKGNFGYIESSCGTAYSYGLYRCPHCQQLHAMATIIGFIPDEIFNDKNIIVIESFKPASEDEPVKSEM